MNYVLKLITAMTQVVLNINSKKEWDALKPILDAMNIDYITQGAKMSEIELELLQQAKDDKENGRVFAYTNHRGILGR
jgi:hypothetical protein